MVQAHDHPALGDRDSTRSPVCCAVRCAARCRIPVSSDSRGVRVELHVRVVDRREVGGDHDRTVHLGQLVEAHRRELEPDLHPPEMMPSRSSFSGRETTMSAPLCALMMFSMASLRSVPGATMVRASARARAGVGARGSQESHRYGLFERLDLDHACLSVNRTVFSCVRGCIVRTFRLYYTPEAEFDQFRAPPGRPGDEAHVPREPHLP